MTAKQQLRERIDELTETEAADTLAFLVERQHCDTLDRLLASASLDNEPTTPDEDRGPLEAREQIARGEVFSAEQIKREIA